MEVYFLSLKIMKFVEPIRNISKIETIKKILKADKNYRDLLLFVCGINFALRIWDLIKLQVKDLVDENNQIKENFIIKEQKTWKLATRTITNSIKEALELYFQKYPFILNNKENYLFFRLKAKNRWENHITRRAGLDVIKKLTSLVWLQWNYWSHTLRKTWGYQARKKDVPLSLIQYKLNHSSMKITERYLGITADEIEKVDNMLNL